MERNALENVIGEGLHRRQMTLAVAESCSGGLVSHRITNVPGSSDYFLGAVVAYANVVKQALLSVRADSLLHHGAVSEPVAREMACGVRQLLQTDVGLSVTGVAGPGGGSPDKPVGLVFVGLSAPEGEWIERHLWDGGREENKARSAEAALDLLRRYLQGDLTRQAP